MKKIIFAICLCVFFLVSVSFAEKDYSQDQTKDISISNGEVDPSAAITKVMKKNLEQEIKNEEELPIKEKEKQNDINAILWGVPQNDKVEKFVNYFKTKLRERFSVWLARSTRYLPIISKIFEEHGIAEELVFLPLIESGFSPYATSRAQAVGIWQFIKGTAQRYGLRVDKFVDERRDPEKSARAAAMYLKDLYEMFGSWDLALAAYNAGEGKIMRIISSKGSKDFWEVISHKKVKKETKEYVPRFVAATLIAKSPEEHGFDNISYSQPLEFEEVILPSKTTLSSVASIIGVDETLLKEYNPAIKHGVLPPDTDYAVRIPKDKVELLREKINLIKTADSKTIKKIMAIKEKNVYKKKKFVRKTKKIAHVKRIDSPS